MGQNTAIDSFYNAVRGESAPASEGSPESLLRLWRESKTDPEREQVRKIQKYRHQIAKDALKFAESDLKRLEGLREKGFVSTPEVERAQSRQAQASGALEIIAELGELFNPVVPPPTLPPLSR